jgi:DNA-binding IclR family transcriptional regulator
MLEEHGKAYYLYKTGGEQAVEGGAYTLGSRRHLNTTAGGKLVLAHIDDEVLDRHGLGSMTPNSITDRAGLTEELDTICEDGIAFDDEEAAIGIRSVAVPVGGVNGLIGTVTVSGPENRLDGDRLAETARAGRYYPDQVQRRVRNRLLTKGWRCTPYVAMPHKKQSRRCWHNGITA